MNEVLMFNPNSLAQQFISGGNKNDIDKLKEAGWVQNPRLVNMYNPHYKKYVMVPIQDQKLWETKGYFSEPTMIYHPKDGTEMVSSEEAKKRTGRGWYLSPAHFPGNSEGAIKTPNVQKEAAA